MALRRRKKSVLRNPDEVAARAEYLRGVRGDERDKLDAVRRYWKGVQRLPAVIPSSAPAEVREMARIARVNVCEIVIDSLAQSAYVDNFRAGGSDAEVWKVWQANKMDSRQGGIHRAAFAYGTAYAVVMPGDGEYPVIRGVSPRNMTALYGDNPDWPVEALECLNGVWRYYDPIAVYLLEERTVDDGSGTKQLVVVGEPLVHGAGVVPVVRYIDAEDLDRDDDVEDGGTLFGDQLRQRPIMQGQISPLMPVQDQIDLTTFSLLTAQWYSAFRQRWAIGWTAEDESQAMKAAASQLWTFDEAPEDMKLGEFGQTNLDGFIESRKESIRHAATLSQTPVHELIGEMVNLSAEAVAAAEAGHERKVSERRMTLGEAHEQTLRLAGHMGGFDVPEDAAVVWRDTSSRSLASLVDALGKMAQMLSVPAEELWERIPGVTKQDIERWTRAKAQADAEAEAKAREMAAQEPDVPPAATDNTN